MARRCEVCGRGPATGYAVSHSNRHTKRRWQVNLQRARVRLGQAARRLYVCTVCLKSGRVQRAL